MRALISSMLICFSGLIYAEADPLIITSTTEPILIGRHVEYLATNRTERIENVLLRSGWQESAVDVLNFGSTSKAYWLRLEIENQTSQEDFYLEVNLPYLDHFELFDSVDFGIYSSKVVGDIYPFEEREVAIVNPSTSLTVHENSQRVLFLKVMGNQNLTLPISIKAYFAGADMIKDELIFFNRYFGGMLSIIILSFCGWIVLKIKIFIYYMVYLVLVFFAQTFTSFGHVALIFRNPVLDDLKLYVVITSVGPAALMFIYKFLKLSPKKSKLENLIKLFSWLYVLCPLIYIIGDAGLAFRFISFLNFAGSILAIFIGISAHLKGNKYASIFLWSWLPFLLGIILFILQINGVIEYSMISQYAMPTGSAVQSIILVLGFGYTVKMLQIEKTELVVKLKETQNEHESLYLEIDHYKFETFKHVFNPHFVINSLTSVQSSLYKSRIDRAKEKVVFLSRMLRSAIRLSLNRQIKLNEELYFIEQYLQLNVDRYDKELKWSFSGIQCVGDLMMPALFLQPIVENSIKHAFGGFQGNPEIKIECFEFLENYILVRIADNGKGFRDINQIITLNKGISPEDSHGYYSIIQRMNHYQNLYPNVSLSIKDRSEMDSNLHGTVVELILPILN